MINELINKKSGKLELSKSIFLWRLDQGTRPWYGKSNQGGFWELGTSPCLYWFNNIGNNDITTSVRVQFYSYAGKAYHVVFSNIWDWDFTISLIPIKVWLSQIKSLIKGLN